MSDSGAPGQTVPPSRLDPDREAELRREIAHLKEKIERTTGHEGAQMPAPVRPSSGTLRFLFLGLVIVLAVAFAAGYLPRANRDKAVAAENETATAAAPRVLAIRARLADQTSELEFPGSVQAVTEAPILARADGYLKRRIADIGDQVKAGQLLAEIEAPELDQQVQQAKATVLQVRAALDQANANLEQGKANEQLAQVTAKRWDNLLARGAVSRQENDTYQAQFRAQNANVRALQQAVAAAQSNLVAAEANLARLQQLLGYQMVRAPFAGVITVRNIDTGALIAGGQTLLYRIAQTGMLRTYINVPQTYADAVHAGQPATLRVNDIAGRTFEGKVVRTSNSLDPSSRTLLVEVQVPNQKGELIPGMYAQVTLTSQRQYRPILLSGDTIVVRGKGTAVAVLHDNKVHFQQVQIGRDFGGEVEILSGLKEGDLVVKNPNDEVREGREVIATVSKAPAAPAAAH